MVRKLAASLALALLVDAAAPALAQPAVDHNLYRGALRQRGNELAFCVWQRSPTAALDRAIATKLAGSLLLGATFYDLNLAGDGIDENFQETLFIALADHCDVAMGMTLDWQPLPNWLTITSSYYDAPYLLAVRTDDPSAGLADIHAAAPVASLMFTGADMALVNYFATVPEGARPKRLPYDTTERALEHLAAGKIAAALVFGPSFYTATAGNPAAAGFKLIATDPLVIPPKGIGALLLARDTFLRAELDRSILSLRQSREIDQMLADNVLPPEP